MKEANPREDSDGESKAIMTIRLTRRPLAAARGQSEKRTVVSRGGGCMSATLVSGIDALSPAPLSHLGLLRCIRIAVTANLRRRDGCFGAWFTPVTSRGRKHTPAAHERKERKYFLKGAPKGLRGGRKALLPSLDGIPKNPRSDKGDGNCRKGVAKV